MSWRTRRRSGHVRPTLRLLALLTALGIALSAGAATAPAFEAKLRVYPLEVLLNGAPVGIWPIIERDGEVFAPPEAFDAWRLQRPASAGQLEFKGLTYYSLASLSGSDVKVDAVQNTLAVNVKADAFTGARLKREATLAIGHDAVVPSAFLNYDLSFTENQARGAAGSRSLGMLGEAGFSNAWGLFTNSFAARDLLGGPAETGPRLLRLETTFRHDLPDSGYTLRLGDATTRTGSLGRPTLYGGIQIGTNFGLAPSLNRQPLPVILGQTLTPSTVQLYVNDVLRQTAKVPAGPFTLEAAQALTGNGDINVVVRDILGRETVISQPFFISADLLAPGLNDWSFEAGKLRHDLGSSNSGYADGFASGMWRRGLSTTFTGEARAEVSRTRTVLGLAGVQALGRQFLARGGIAGSHDEELGRGTRWSASLDWQGRANSALVSAEGNARTFRYLGEPVSAVPPRLQVAAQGNVFVVGHGRVGAGLAVQFPYDLPRVATASLGYTTVIRDNWQLNVNISRAVGPSSGTTVGFMLIVPLSKRNSSTLSTQVRQGAIDTYATVSHTPESAYGTAWRVLGGYQAQPRAEGSLYYFGERGIASSELSATPDEAHLRLGATGALLFAGSRLFAMPRHDMSAALVSVPGYAGVGVGLGQQVTTHTDADGYALVPRLNAYQPNPIRLDPNDLPVTAEIDSIEQPIVPPWRSVSLVTFAVRGGRAAVIRMVLADGRQAPAGATLRIVGEDRPFYVGRHGDAYVTGLKEKNRLELRWRESRCEMEVDLPAGKPDEVARVGPVTCKGAVAQ